VLDQALVLPAGGRRARLAGSTKTWSTCFPHLPDGRIHPRRQSMTRKTSIPSEAGIISKMVVYLYSSHDDLEATTCDLAAPRAVPGMELVPYRAIRGSPFEVLATHHGPAGPSGSGTAFPFSGAAARPLTYLLTYLLTVAPTHPNALYHPHTIVAPASSSY